MNNQLLDKKYSSLLKDRARLDRELMAVWLKKIQPKNIAKDLLSLTKLGIKGGPKDLSSKLDAYLYQE